MIAIPNRKLKILKVSTKSEVDKDCCFMVIVGLLLGLNEIEM